MRTFEETYRQAIAEIERLDNGEKIVFVTRLNTVAKTLGAEKYDKNSAGFDLIERFVSLKKEKGITVFFRLPDLRFNSSSFLNGIGQANIVDSKWIEKHPEIKLIEL